MIGLFILSFVLGVVSYFLLSGQRLVVRSSIACAVIFLPPILMLLYLGKIGTEPPRINDYQDH